MRLGLLFAVLPVLACSKTEGGIHATVDFVRVDRGPACLRIAVVDLATVGSDTERFQPNNVDLTQRELTGSISVGIVRDLEHGWSDGVEVRASLHRNNCTTDYEVLAKESARFIENEIVQLHLTVRQSPLDGGAGGGAAGGSVMGGGSAGGTVAGGPAGGSVAGGSAGGSVAGGSAGGVVAGGSAGGVVAGGSAGGVVAGGSAGGVAAGGSAGGVVAGGPAGGLAGGASGGGAAGGSAGGSAPCASITPRYFVIGDGGTSWNDLVAVGDDFILVGTNSAIVRYNVATGTLTDLGGGTCSSLGHLTGVTSRPDAGDSELFLTNSAGRMSRWTSAGTCATFSEPSVGYTPAIKGTGTFVFLGGFTGDPSTAGSISLLAFNSDAGVAGNSMPGTGQVWEFGGNSSSLLFAAGSTFPQNRAHLWQYNRQTNTWGTEISTNANETPLYAIDVPSATTGIATGSGITLAFNGTAWTSLAAPPFQVYGVRMLGPLLAVGVGTDSNGRAGFATWNGSTWTNITTPTPPMKLLKRIRGNSQCTLLGVGIDGQAVTTSP